jgi:hypothetical protein
MNRKLNSNQYIEIYNLYFKEELSQQAIANKFNVSQNCIRKVLKRNGWNSRTHKECADKRKPHLQLNKWRETNKPWNTGLTSDDPRIKALIEKGAETQRKNGKSKGKNNPMWGKVVNHRRGFREDLNHSVRSNWEANFARILKFLNLKYLYEYKTFELANNKTYTPDFYIPSKNIFYEIKGYEYTTKHKEFKQQFPDITLRIIREKEYRRIMKRFKSRINFEGR